MAWRIFLDVNITTSYFDRFVEESFLCSTLFFICFCFVLFLFLFFYLFFFRFVFWFVLSYCLQISSFFQTSRIALSSDMNWNFYVFASIFFTDRKLYFAQNADNMTLSIYLPICKAAVILDLADWCLWNNSGYIKKRLFRTCVYKNWFIICFFTNQVCFQRRICHR